MTIKHPSIIISLLTFSDIYSPEKGTRMLANWLKKYPQLLPEKLFWYEGKNSTYPVEGVHTFVPGVVTKWSKGQFMPFWTLGGQFHSTRRSKPKSTGFFSFSDLDRQKSSKMMLEISYDPKMDWRQIFLDLSDWFEADFGWLHLWTDHEVEMMRKGKSEGWGTLFTGTYHVDRLRGFPSGGMPHLGWLNLYRGAFLPVMGKNLPKVPEAHRSEREGAILVQLSERLDDLITDYDRVEATRQEIKTIIGREYFESLVQDPNIVGPRRCFFHPDGTIGLRLI